MRTLTDAGRFDEALAVCEELIRQAEQSGPESRVAVADAMWLKCEVLHFAGRHVDELSTGDALRARFGEALEPRLAVLIGQALAVKCCLAWEDVSPAAALEAGEVLRSRFVQETRAGVLEALGERVVKAGGCLAEHEAFDVALALFDAVINRFAGATAPGELKLRADAQIQAAACLTRAGRINEAMTAYQATFSAGEAGAQAWEDVANNASPDGDPDTERRRAAALMGRAVALGGAQQLEPTLSLVEEIIDQYKDTQDPILRQILAFARKGQAELLTEQGHREA